MTVYSKISEDGKQLTISIEERFDFSLHQQFRAAYHDNVTPDLTYILDLSKTDYMDSSALGMILLLKDHVQLHTGTLIIDKPNDTVNKILEIAQFHRLMTIT
ncbi:STAS domain-containing protein [Colwellia sp. D2M02]|uniref:STAS domain-containing protein n=1 Tax=Colwellia asteriadis TaxID=517723 RepID=A0ABN1L802_9GAMM|nr:STAS domain-containing protein [Colwellia sp. D2M02]MBU2892573.1 STAS domain-containing protein [Colwellia sp. D2M02]